MSNYQTGDLLLINQWSVSSILHHAVDPVTQWSDIGIFIVEQPPKSARGPINGYVNKANETAEEHRDDIRVLMMTINGLKLFTVDEILRTPSVQAAAHRPLAVQDRKAVQQYIASYIANIVQKVAQDPKRITNNPFPPGLKALLSENSSTGYTRSSHGTLLDSRGRDVKVSGFVKGNPDSQIKSEFTNTDLIGSILAQADLIKYDPEIKLSDFQEGGLLDDIYGNEVQLFPRKPAEEVRQYLLKQARAEAELMVMQYFKSLPTANFDHYRSSIPFATPQSEQPLENENEEDDEFGTDYPDQALAAYTTSAARERRGNTNAIALIVESDTIDQKIRQREEEAEKYSRPKPTYKRTEGSL